MRATNYSKIQLQEKNALCSLQGERIHKIIHECDTNIQKTFKCSGKRVHFRVNEVPVNITNVTKALAAKC